MPRFQGIPVEEPAQRGGRFGGIPLDAKPNDTRSFLEKTQAVDNPIGAVLKAPDMFLRGMTGTGSDYVEAGMNYALDRVMPPEGGKRTFEQSLQDVSRKYQTQRQNAPVTGTTAEIAGAVTSPLVRGVAKGAEALTSMVPNIPRYLQYALQGAGVGGALGIPLARNESGGVPTVGDVAGTAGASALAGGVLGAAFPAAVEVGSATLRGASNAARPLLDRLPGRQSDAAARILAKRITSRGAQLSGFARLWIMS
jgi:hypothetical protein